jgi:hypothetical protein
MADDLALRLASAEKEVAVALVAFRLAEDESVKAEFSQVLLPQFIKTKTGPGFQGTEEGVHRPCDLSIPPKFGA